MGKLKLAKELKLQHVWFSSKQTHTAFFKLYFYGNKAVSFLTWPNTLMEFRMVLDHQTLLKHKQQHPSLMNVNKYPDWHVRIKLHFTRDVTWLWGTKWHFIIWDIRNNTSHVYFRCLDQHRFVINAHKIVNWQSFSEILVFVWLDLVSSSKQRVTSNMYIVHNNFSLIAMSCLYSWWNQ